jgi:hypothetical protein
MWSHGPYTPQSGGNWGFLLSPSLLPVEPGLPCAKKQKLPTSQSLSWTIQPLRTQEAKEPSGLAYLRVLKWLSNPTSFLAPQQFSLFI